MKTMYLVSWSGGSYDAYTENNICVCNDMRDAETLVNKLNEMYSKHKEMERLVRSEMTDWDNLNIEPVIPKEQNKKAALKKQDKNQWNRLLASHTKWCNDREQMLLDTKNALYPFAKEEDEMIVSLDIKDAFDHYDAHFGYAEVPMFEE